MPLGGSGGMGSAVGPGLGSPGAAKVAGPDPVPNVGRARVQRIKRTNVENGTARIMNFGPFADGDVLESLLVVLHVVAGAGGNSDGSLAILSRGERAVSADFTVTAPRGRSLIGDDNPTTGVQMAQMTFSCSAGQSLVFTVPLGLVVDDEGRYLSLMFTSDNVSYFVAAGVFLSGPSR